MTRYVLWLWWSRSLTCFLQTGKKWLAIKKKNYLRMTSSQNRLYPASGSSLNHMICTCPTTSQETFNDGYNDNQLIITEIILAFNEKIMIVSASLLSRQAVGRRQGHWEAGLQTCRNRLIHADEKVCTGHGWVIVICSSNYKWRVSL